MKALKLKTSQGLSLLGLQSCGPQIGLDSAGYTLLVPGSGLPVALAEPSLRGIPVGRGRPTPRLENAAGLATCCREVRPVHLPLLFRHLRWFPLLGPALAPRSGTHAPPRGPPHLSSCISRDCLPGPRASDTSSRLVLSESPLRLLAHIHYEVSRCPGSGRLVGCSLPFVSPLLPETRGLSSECQSSVLGTPSWQSPHLASCCGHSHACLIRPKPRGAYSF